MAPSKTVYQESVAYLLRFKELLDKRLVSKEDYERKMAGILSQVLAVVDLQERRQIRSGNTDSTRSWGNSFLEIKACELTFQEGLLLAIEE